MKRTTSFSSMAASTRSRTSSSVMSLSGWKVILPDTRQGRKEVALVVVADPDHVDERVDRHARHVFDALLVHEDDAGDRFPALLADGLDRLGHGRPAGDGVVHDVALPVPNLGEVPREGAAQILYVALFPLVFARRV